eukprot:9465205-Pyramimonas_sp.AAC.1
MEHPLSYYDAQGTVGPTGGRVELNCAGPAHVFLQDVDGTLTGQVGTLLGAAAPARARVDQGAPIVAGPCASQHSSLRGWDLHHCASGHDAKTYPAGPGRPLRGLFADPQLFVAESRDADREDRNTGPLKMTDLTTNTTDLLVASMDHGWCFG